METKNGPLRGGEPRELLLECDGKVPGEGDSGRTRPTAFAQRVTGSA